jgi:endonuclease G
MSTLCSRPGKTAFVRIPRIANEDDSAALTDYEDDDGLFDRGHMAPRAAFNRSECAMFNTFVLSNMAPQHDRFNRCQGRWLERDVRDWAESKEEIFVIVGAVFDRDGDGERDPDSSVERIANRNRVALPTYFYKIILHTRPNTFVESMTFPLPNIDENPGFDDRQT